MKLDRKDINLTDLLKKEFLWENCQLRFKVQTIYLVIHQAKWVLQIINQWKI